MGRTVNDYLTAGFDQIGGGIKGFGKWLDAQIGMEALPREPG